MSKNGKIIDIIGVPSDFGANIPGALMGPAALRTSGIHEKLRRSGRETSDLGDTEVPNRYNLPFWLAENHYLPVIRTVCEKLKNTCLSSHAAGHIPLVLGGDHSISIGSVSATCSFYKGKKIGLIWVNSHADINTPETTPSGNIHGMPVSLILGKGYAELLRLFEQHETISAGNIVFLGLRDIDAAEKDILRESGVDYYTMRDVDEKGILKIMKEVMKHHFINVDGIHVSFDLDVMNPPLMPGVSTPVPGGLTLREAHLLLELLSETEKVIAADFVELNPLNDVRGQSAAMAADIICSLFGKTII